MKYFSFQRIVPAVHFTASSKSPFRFCSRGHRVSESELVWVSPALGVTRGPGAFFMLNGSVCLPSDKKPDDQLNLRTNKPQGPSWIALYLLVLSYVSDSDQSRIKQTTNRQESRAVWQLSACPVYQPVFFPLSLCAGIQWGLSWGVGGGGALGGIGKLRHLNRSSVHR